MNLVANIFGLLFREEPIFFAPMFREGSQFFKLMPRKGHFFFPQIWGRADMISFENLLPPLTASIYQVILKS